MKGRLLSGDSQDQSVEGGREMGGSSLGSGPSLLSWGWEAGIGPLGNQRLTIPHAQEGV